MSALETYPHQPPAISSLAFAYHSARSLLHNIPDRPGVIFRPIYEENAAGPAEPPFNVADEVLPSFLHLLEERQTETDLSYYPYWEPRLRYDAAEVFGATIQSVDLHDAPLPKTVLPPEKDVSDFIGAIKDGSERVKLDQQFNVALDITNDNLVGATNLCWIAVRFMARGADQRAYPNIPMNERELRQWNGHLAQFEIPGTDKNDGPGDNYYFWTHVFGAIAFSDHGVKAKLAQVAFSRGTEIMEFVRKNIARKQPNITAHQPASSVGRQVGLALTKLSTAPVETSMATETV